MKTKLALFALLLASVMMSCSTNDEPTGPYATFKLDYSFSSGTLTRSADDVYSDYYEKCVLTKQNTPKHFDVMFNHSDKLIYNHSGTWDKDNGFCIPTGTYKLTGSSTPKNQYYVSDSVYIKIDTDLTITLNQEVITIPAKYDCYLLLFKADNIKSVSYYGNNRTQIEFKPNNGYYGIYINSWYYTDSVIRVIKNNDDKIDISISNPRFTKGNYYYFNDATNTFALDPMENGSE